MGTRDRGKGTESVREELHKILVSEMLAPLPNEPIERIIIEERIEAAYPKLVKIARRDPSAVRRLIVQPDYGAPDTHGLYYEARVTLVRILDRVDKRGEELYQLATDDRAEWYVKRDAIRSLGHRGEQHLVEELIGLITDMGIQGEVRAAALEAMATCGVQKALPVVQRLYKEQRTPGWWDSRRALLKARGLLGDRSALRDLIALRYADHWLDRESGREGLAPLINHLGGLEGALAALQKAPRSASLEDQLNELARNDKDEEIRCWALEQLVHVAPGKAHDILLRSLGDPDWLVAADASNRLTELKEPPRAGLHEIAEDTSGPDSLRLWAIYTLLRLGECVGKAAHKIPEIRIPLPATVPAEVRDAIVRKWAPESEPETDVRWLIEAMELPEATPVNYEDMLSRLVRELYAQGVTTGPCEDYASTMEQGHGTFWILPVDEDQLNISKLGPFVAFVYVQTNEDGVRIYTTDPSQIEGNKTKLERAERCRRIATAAGFTWLDEGVLEVVFKGLKVYRFGSRKPLKIGELLFYWQD
jgi:HEAT repeat protein